MTDKTFEDYKQEMRDYLAQYRKERAGQSSPDDKTTDKRDIIGLTENMRRTFPEEPEPSDRIAMCYAYFHRSTMLMEESYYKDWREQAKKYISDVEAGKNDNNLYFSILVLEQTKQHGTPANNLKYAEDAFKKMTKEGQSATQTKDVMGRVARECYDAQIKEIDDNNQPKTNEEYRKQMRRFDRAVDTLVKIPEGSRYGEMYKLLPKMQKLYYMSEGGRVEFDGSRHEKGKAAKIRSRVYKSMSTSTQMHIRNQRSKNDSLWR